MRIGSLLAGGLFLLLFVFIQVAAGQSNDQSATKTSPPSALGVGAVASPPTEAGQTESGGPPAAKVLPPLGARPVPKSNVKLSFKVGQKSMTVNGAKKQLDVAPIINAGRTMLPVRHLAEPLGAVVGWDQQERAATVTLGPTTIILWLGKEDALVNGVPTPIDPDNSKVVPLEQGGRILLPARFIAENLGVAVNWNAAEGIMTLNSGESGGAPSGWFRVKGVVRNSLTGNPLPGLTLTAKADQPPPYTFNATTGDDGSFSIDLPNTSSFSITLSAPYYQAETWRVNASGWLAISAAPNTPPLSEVPKEGYYRIFGFVKDQNGQLLTDAGVSAKPVGNQAGAKESYYLTDASGFFYLDWPKWQTVQLGVEKKGYSYRGVILVMGPPPTPTGEGGPINMGPANGPSLRRIEALPADGMVQFDLTVQANQAAVPKPSSGKPAPGPAPQVNYGLLHYSSYTAGAVDIYLDGVYLGPNPIYNFPVSVGWHRLFVQTPNGMVIVNQNLYMSAGGRWLYN